MKLNHIYIKCFLILASNSSAWSAFAGDFIRSVNPIRDQYIVVLKDATLSHTARENHLRGLASSQKVNFRFAFKSVLNGGVIKMNQSNAIAMAKHPSVAYIEEDALVRTVGLQTSATWGIDRIDQASLPLNSSYNYMTTGTGVNVYVIDTGIQIDHVEFGGRASVATDILGGNGIDCNGHGTHVAGTIGGSTYGVAKDVRLYAVRVLDCSGSGTTSGVIAGVDWVTSYSIKPSVANMSLGGGRSTSLDAAVTKSI